MLTNITVDTGKCTGCNKCIYVCPVKANVANLTEDGNKIEIDAEKCIMCGKCLAICDHKARSFTDDTERFFNDLKTGAKISILAAPSIRINFRNNRYKRLLGYLKKCGISGVYDVSFGADITTWGYLKAYKSGAKSIIAQPCPVIVNYIEKYVPEIMDRLSPIQSPVMCAAIYLKEYEGSTDRLAFLSPCIGKSSEFTDRNTGHSVEYNVTFAKLKEYLKKHNVSLNQYKEKEFDDIKCEMGFLFSRPGGLSENVRFHNNDLKWIRQVEGATHVKKYLDEYKGRKLSRRTVPELVDILNCEYGCNIGTGTDNEVEIDEIDDIMNSSKGEKLCEYKENSKKLFEMFDSKLDVNKFKRKYTAKRVNIRQPSDEEVNNIFENLDKNTEESRNINCFSCGYGNCLEFARAVARGENHIENCANYSRNVLERKKKIFNACESVKDSIENINQSNEDSVKQISGILKNVGDLAGSSDQLKTNLENMIKSAESMKGATRQLDDIARQTKLIALNALIEAAHAGKFGVTFGVVANEVRDLAQRSANAVETTKSNQNTISANIDSTNETFGTMGQIVDLINGSINSVSEHISDVDEKCESVYKTLDELVESN